MTDRKLIGIVTALLFLTASQGARAEIKLEQLLVIDQLLSNNNTQALYDYLERNPELLTGKDELSEELRNFHDAASAGSLDFDYAVGAPANPDDAAAADTQLH